MKNPKARTLFVEALASAYDHGKQNDPIVQLVQSRLIAAHKHS